MGILGYPNMDDNNHDGIFGDYSDIYSNYSEDTVGAQAATPSANEVQQSAEPTQTGAIPPVAPQTERQSNGRLMFYIVVLGLLLISAAVMYLYKKNADVSAESEQSMGDYFYNQATGNADVQPPQDAATATIEVELAEEQATVNVNPPEAKAPVQQNVSNEDNVIAKADKLTPKEKVEAKKKADAEKEKQVTLSASSVTIPVFSGGRRDPFLPANMVIAKTETSEFELIAPPTFIPESDPMVDALMSIKISGIMYEPTRPSALINISGSDQLVHRGDIVKGYKITDITPTSVAIQYKSNTYQVTVGQSVSSGVNINQVSNLSKSFGGVYSASEDVIEFNN